MALFVITGTDVALSAAAHDFSAAIIGTISGVGGGMIRDVLRVRSPVCSEPGTSTPQRPSQALCCTSCYSSSPCRQPSLRGSRPSRSSRSKCCHSTTGGACRGSAPESSNDRPGPRQEIRRGRTRLPVTRSVAREAHEEAGLQFVVGGRDAGSAAGPVSVIDSGAWPGSQRTPSVIDSAAWPRRDGHGEAAPASRADEKSAPCRSAPSKSADSNRCSTNDRRRRSLER